MLKKAKAAMSEGAAGDVKDLAKSVLDSSHQIWLAGARRLLAGASRKATKVFESLVKQGEQLRATKPGRRQRDTAAAARGAATAKAKEMQQMAGGTWDKLEQVFEDRVARALSKLGVYTQNDVQRLAERVDELAAAVNELVKSSGSEAGRGIEAQGASASTTPGPKKSMAASASARARKGPAKPRSAA